MDMQENRETQWKKEEPREVRGRVWRLQWSTPQECVGVERGTGGSCLCGAGVQRTGQSRVVIDRRKMTPALISRTVFAFL